MGGLSPAVHRTIVAVDVEGFGDRRRTNRDQAAVRSGLYRSLRHALAESGVPWETCHNEDRGDGVLVLVRPEVAKSVLASRFPERLAAQLRGHNRAAAPAARIRLRLALHAGEIHHDEHGVVGTAVTMAFRLLEAGGLKSALARSSGVLAMIVSDWFFQEVIRHDRASRPTEYRRIRVSVKETSTAAWIRLPDRADPPGEEPGAAPGTVAPVPGQLPAPIPGFVGRDREQKWLSRALDDLDTAMPISVISGFPGVGKTALAVHWAHSVRDFFPDGQLYVNLRGHHHSPPMSPEQALDGFLRALGVPLETIPAELDEQAALYRSVLDRRRVLVVLDNAGSAEQVRPLLPGSPGCLVVVTSRSHLSGLVAREGAERLVLGALSERESVALLRQVIGTARHAAEPGAAAVLARRCAYLPLALRIAAERVASRPHATLVRLVEDLAEEGTRLDVLTADETTTEMRSVFSWSYRALPPPAARMFRLLGLHPGPDIGVRAAAAIAGIAPARARGLLDTLAGVHLLEETGPRRYRFHDLMRDYAVELAEAEETAEEREAAVRRLLTWYLHTARAADHRLFPYRRRVEPDPPEEGSTPQEFADYDEALAWCDTEHANLVAAVHQAAEHGLHTIAWQLPAMLWGSFQLRRRWTDWITTNRIALDAARAGGDRYGEAWAVNYLAAATWDLKRLDEAHAYCLQTLDLSRRLGDRWLESAALVCLGAVHNDLGRFEEAIELFVPGRAMSGEAGERINEGVAIIGLGNACTGLRRFEEATGHYLRAIDHFHRYHNPWGLGWALQDFARSCLLQGRLEQAIDLYRQALDVRRTTDERHIQAEILAELGDALHRTGRHDEAHDSWRQALTLFDALKDPKAADIRTRLKPRTTGPTSTVA